jgi:hypothetical protein
MRQSYISKIAFILFGLTICWVPFASAEDGKLESTSPVLKLEGSNGGSTTTTPPVKPSAKRSTKPAAKIRVEPKPKLGAVAPINDFELGRYQYCGSDSDCIVANNGCCDCANGGKDVAVNKDRLADFRKRFDCLYAKCGDKRRDPICGSGVVSCIMHKCKYFPPGEGMEDRF